MGSIRLVPVVIRCQANLMEISPKFSPSPLMAAIRLSPPRMYKAIVDRGRNSYSTGDYLIFESSTSHNTPSSYSRTNFELKTHISSFHVFHRNLSPPRKSSFLRVINHQWCPIRPMGFGDSRCWNNSRWRSAHRFEPVGWRLERPVPWRNIGISTTIPWWKCHV